MNPLSYAYPRKMHIKYRYFVDLLGSTALFTRRFWKDEPGGVVLPFEGPASSHNVSWTFSSPAVYKAPWWMTLTVHSGWQPPRPAFSASNALRPSCRELFWWDSLLWTAFLFLPEKMDFFQSLPIAQQFLCFWWVSYTLQQRLGTIFVTRENSSSRIIFQQLGCRQFCYMYVFFTFSISIDFAVCQSMFYYSTSYLSQYHSPFVQIIVRSLSFNLIQTCGCQTKITRDESRRK